MHQNASTEPTQHGWWIDGEYVPCPCVKCSMDREEAEEAAYVAR